MAITKLQSEALNLADDYTFTGELSGHMYPACTVSLSANQTSVPDSTDTKVEFNTIEFDTDSNFDTTNNKYVVSVAATLASSLVLNLMTSIQLMLMSSSLSSATNKRPRQNCIYTVRTFFVSPIR